MLIRSRTNSLFIVLAVFASAIAILVFTAGFKLTNLVLPQIIHILNELFAFCQARVNTIFTKSNKFSSLLTFAAPIVVVFWIYIIRPITKTVNLLKNIQVARPTSPFPLKEILKELSVSFSQVVLYKSHKSSVFCAGFCKPKIYISSNLIKRLNANELTAVLAHETQHLRNYDPLRTFLISIIEKLFFFMPLIKQLSGKIRLTQETIADDFALSFVGKKTYLKTIVKIDKINFSQFISESTGFESLLNKRVKHLLGMATKLNKRKFFIDLITTQVVFLALILLNSMPLFFKSKTAHHIHTKNMCKISYLHDCCIS